MREVSKAVPGTFFVKHVIRRDAKDGISSGRKKQGEKRNHLAFRAVFMFPHPLVRDRKSCSPPLAGASWTAG
jgi:hypothetical protein